MTIGKNWKVVAAAVLWLQGDEVEAWSGEAKKCEERADREAKGYAG